MLISIVIFSFFVFAIFFTIKYKFIQLKCFKVAKKIMFKDKSKTAYQTFLVSLASHIGTGNIVGVISALVIGGPGSLFWMWIFAFFSSIFSLIENTLAQVYKESIDGEMRGGSCFYIYKGLDKKYIALIIAIFLVLSNTIFFQPLQINTVSESLIIITKLPKYAVFIILSLFTILVIFKGTQKIIKFSEIVVPIMSIGYILIGLFVLIFNIQMLPNIFYTIFKEAFNVNSIIGGCFFVGIKRSLFSHEAGLGTMPTISAMSNVKNPTDQGFICAFGVFIDTIVLCSITGLMILVYNVDIINSTYTGCDLIVYVFTNIFGSFGKYLGVFFMISFALATAVSQYYLGESNLKFINKYFLSIKMQKVGMILYRGLFLIGIFIGVFISLDSIWSIIDIGLVLLGIFNIYAMIKLRKVFDLQIK